VTKIKILRSVCVYVFVFVWCLVSFYKRNRCHGQHNHFFLCSCIGRIRKYVAVTQTEKRRECVTQLIGTCIIKGHLVCFDSFFLNVPNEQKKYLKKEISNKKFGAIRKVRLSSISCFDCCCCRVRVCCSVCMCVSVRHLNRRVLCLGDVVGNMVG
jgi:hypothetical protein